QSAESYSAAFDAMEEWIVIVDDEARILFMNRPYAQFIGVNREEVVGQRVTDVIENTRMHLAVETGKRERTALQEIQGNHMIANRYPIIEGGKIIGAVGTVLFHDTHEWRQINSQIKALLAERDFYHQETTGGGSKTTGAHFRLNDIIGRSPAIHALNDKVTKVASGDVSVLIRGESGTGKELYAHAIHQLSERADHPFIKVNCAAIPENLLEAELFGYADGAFTGARKGGKPGKFQLADGGTLFLDEIGDMPLSMQVKLLRVLQDREVEAVGATRLVPVNIRLVSATHQPLEELITAGKFREDLYYRVNVVPLNLPPLRERPEDIPALTEHFLARLARRTGRRTPKLTSQALTSLLEHTWPGNIRELENVLEATFYTVQGRKISLSALPDHIAGARARDVVTGGTLKERMESTERLILREALKTCNDNRLRTARYLGISKSTLYEKLARFGL
ncbi:MAG: sigma 54-interacting transcriptional regulator, partial [Natronospirillum sp.]